MMGRLPTVGIVADRGHAGRRLFDRLRHIAAVADPKGCGHRGALRVLCVQHPEAGPRCPACQDQHVAGHSRVDENRCDGCGDPSDPITPAWIPLGTGVVIGSIGYCDPCTAELQGGRGGRG